MPVPAAPALPALPAPALPLPGGPSSVVTAVRSGRSAKQATKTVGKTTPRAHWTKRERGFMAPSFWRFSGRRLTIRSPGAHFSFSGGAGDRSPRGSPTRTSAGPSDDLQVTARIEIARRARRRRHRSARGPGHSGRERRARGADAPLVASRAARDGDDPRAARAASPRARGRRPGGAAGDLGVAGAVSGRVHLLALRAAHRRS